MSTDALRDEPHPGGLMSVEEYLQLDKNALNAKYEYLDGVARLMSGGSWAHDRISRNIANAIDEHFQSGPCFVSGSDMQVLVGYKRNGKEAYTYPDVTVSCDVADRRRDNTLIRSPRIVVEVLSPSIANVDRGQKLKTYQTCATIQEVVLIDQFTQAVEVYRHEYDSNGTSTWSSTFFGPDSTIELTSVDVHITMAEIYKGIDFDEPLTKGTEIDGLGKISSQR